MFLTGGSTIQEARAKALSKYAFSIFSAIIFLNSANFRALRSERVSFLSVICRVPPSIGFPLTINGLHECVKSKFFILQPILAIKRTIPDVRPHVVSVTEKQRQRQKQRNGISESVPIRVVSGM
jgi:hypothetical protein